MPPIPASSASSLLDSRSVPFPRDILSSLAKRLAASTSLSQSRTIPSKLVQFIRRQSTSAIIPSAYGSINSGPSPGTIVGIVLGSVGGFLVILWLIYTCLNFGNWASSSEYTESVVIRDRRKSHGSARSRRVSETVEVRRERSPIRVVREPERVERVVVEEERREVRRERSRGASDEVVVIEEHSPPRKSNSKKKRRDDDRRESGFRTVDPLAYGGVVGGRKSSRR